MKTEKSTRATLLFLAQTAVIAALYAALALTIPLFGAQQFRVAEALTLLPVLTPAAIPGLAIGCLIANLGSPFGLIDIVFGTLASLLAALCTYWLRKIQFLKLPLLSALMPALFNGLIIGAVIALMVTDTLDFGAFTLANMLIFGGQVALSELVICLFLGLPLVVLLRKTPIFDKNGRL